MDDAILIGLDFGTESARGVAIEAATGRQVAYHIHPYRHGVMTAALPNGRALPPAFALQDAADYLEAAEAILRAVGGGRRVASIGIDFTASSPLPARADGTPLSAAHPGEPHAYVKLWKHAAAQPQAEAINARGGAFLANFGGKLSGEWLIAKAAELEEAAPRLWAEADRFIEAGDWLVWQLTGREARSLDFAVFKAQYSEAGGYPDHLVPGLAARLAPPFAVGTPAGMLTPAWRARTGISGEAVVAVAVIDSHVVLPAVGATATGALVGALGTSAAYLLLQDASRPLPRGIEGMAEGAALPGLWCYEAGQAGFGDTLAWFVRTFPRDADPTRNFGLYNAEAASLEPGQNHLVALDWWSGNRVPYGDSRLSGVIAGFNLGTTAAGLYRALIEAICYGTRSIVEHMVGGGLPVDRLVVTSGLARNNPLLVSIMADVLGRPIELPDIDHPTAVGAAIHGAVAAGVVGDFAEGGRRYGASRVSIRQPDRRRTARYDTLFRSYRDLCANDDLRRSLKRLDKPG